MPVENSNSPFILIVDDDPDLVEMLSLKLQSEGFQTLVSLNGENYREIIAQQRPDLVLLDLHMKGVSGNDICQELKSNMYTSSIPVVLFSASDNIQMIAGECGADGFLSKPFEPANFTRIISRFVPGMTG